MILIEPINAITSWEDYEYQGHIALYIALKKIYDLLHRGISISGYDLQIEGEEDFSIRKNDKYISIHQVKAGAVKLEPNDKFSFIIEILQNEAQYGYFHISKSKSIPSDFVSTTLKYIDTLQKKLDKKVILKKNIPITDKEDDYIILDKVSGNHKKADVYSIIKFVSGNSKDIAKIEATVSEIDNALKIYKVNIEKSLEKFRKKNPSLPEDEVYLRVYEEKYNNTKEIRLKAYDILIEILKIKCRQYTFVDVDYVAWVYDNLFLYMKEKITDFYIEKNRKGKCILTFDEIVEKIEIDYHEKKDTVAYQYFQVLRSIRDAYEEYPSEPWNNCVESNCRECADSDVCNLFKQISILNGKSEADKNQIIHNLLLKTPQVGKNNNLPQDSLVSHLFLNLLDEIKNLELRRNNAYEMMKDENKTYRLTLDSSYDVDEFQKNLRKELEKEADRSLLYECDVLITDRLCEETLLFNGVNINVLTGNELSEISGITSTTLEKMKKDCNRPKVIRLVDRKTALGELK